MDIRLLGNDNGLKPSPERSAYRLLKDNASQAYNIVVPLDIWFLEADGSGKDRHAGNPRRPPDSWKNIELGRPNFDRGFASLLGTPPNLLLGQVTPFIKCQSRPSFRAISRDQKALENTSKLPIFPQAQVSVGIKASINNRWPAEIINTNVGFALEYLALSVEDIPTYQLRIAGKPGSQMIGSPVVITKSDGKKAVLGMLIGLQPRNDGGGESDAWVLPAEKID